MPLFHVTLSFQTDIEVVVLAADAEAAKDLAASQADTIQDDTFGFNLDVDICGVSEVSALAALPSGWDGKCIPYGDETEETIAELLKVEAAEAEQAANTPGTPEYQQRVEKLGQARLFPAPSPEARESLLSARQREELGPLQPIGDRD